MGAPLSRFLAKIELPKPIFKPKELPPIVLPLPTEGLDVSESDIQTYHDGTLVYKDKRVVVHIRDATHHEPRFHLSNCITLVEMKSQGKFARYVVSEREDGYFHVRMNDGPLVKRKLAVCQNCLDNLSWKGFSRDLMAKPARYAIVNNFSIREFFNKYPNSLHPVMPVHTAESAPVNNYPENWSLIASELKRQLGYYCQSCNRVLGETNKRFLHVHHVNSLKNDCRVENLKCLCIECHSNQHMHQHMKNSSDYLEFKNLFP